MKKIFRRRGGEGQVNPVSHPKKGKGVMHAAKKRFGELRRLVTRGEKTEKKITTGSGTLDNQEESTASRPLTGRSTEEHTPVVPELRSDKPHLQEAVNHPFPQSEYKTPSPVQVKPDSVEGDEEPQDEVPELDYSLVSENIDHDEFIEAHIDPLLKKPKRNAAEKFAGWLGEKLLKKYLPVDVLETGAHKETYR